MVLKPDLSLADNAFIDQVEGGQNNKKLTVLLDKELRAVMLRMMVQILEGYRSCLTIVRIHPKPFITFHKVISSIFEKCSILIQTRSWLNHTSYRNFHFNKFVANALPDNIRRMKKQPLTSENEAVFQFQITKFRVRTNQVIKPKDFYFVFISKCLHISNSRTKPAEKGF